MTCTVKTIPDGADLPIDSLPKTYAYTTISGNSYPQTITVVYANNTYVKTFTYTGTNLTGDSGWVRQ
jgi:hypothetical protein